MIPDLRITIIRSDRKTLSVQIKNGELIARAPLRMKEKDIYAFIDSKKTWIEKHLASSEEAKIFCPSTSRNLYSVFKSNKNNPSFVRCFAMLWKASFN